MDKWVLAGLVIGALIVVISLAGPKIGLGEAQGFLLYRTFGLSRRGLAFLGLLVALAVPAARLVFAFVHSPAGCWTVEFPGRACRGVWAKVKSFMAVPLGKALAILAVNLVIVALMVIGLELLVRSFVKEPDIYATTQPGQYFRFQPYLQSSNEGPLDHVGIWWDSLHKERIQFHVKSNSLGFRVDREFDTTTTYEKRPDERVVLIFGGSAVYGFGNTSNETTSAGWLQRKLNEGQSKYRYKVFNMGNGGWVSYQQLIALNLYGLNLNPDWVIFMDARNDIFTLPALAGDDVGFHFSTPTLRNQVDGYYYRQRSVDFYRGSFENDLIRTSAAYRFITGKQYVPSSQPSRFSGVRDWNDIDRTIDFYLRTQRSVLLQCPSCRFILSTQPIYRSGRTIMGAGERSRLKEKMPDFKVTGESLSDPRFEDVLMYAYGRIVDEMPAVCAVHSTICIYKNMNEVLPAADAEKHWHFVDDVHLRDSGNEIIGAYYASEIIRFDAR